MNRMFAVAWREFVSVVWTRGFLLGVLLPPLMTGIAILAVFLMKNMEGPRVQGHVVIVDHSGVVGEAAVRRLPEDMAARSKEKAEQIKKMSEKTTEALNLSPEQAAQARAMSEMQARQALPTADIHARLGQPDADLEKLKDELRNTVIRAKGESTNPDPLLAIAVIPKGATEPDDNGKFGVFDLFVAPKLDIEIQQGIERSIGDAIVDARIAGDSRIKAAGLDAEYLHSMLARPNIDAVTITKSGERKSIGELQMLIPMGFMLLLMVSVMTTGQYLMTTVVEEKSSRVMEILLSAVSPMQLMTGKILGHMAVGVLIIGIYGSVGVGSLIYFALTQLVTPMTFVLLVCYFICAAVTMAAFMAAIGAAVNELREAQTLMSPVMIITVLPWMIWFVIQRAPNSPLATTLSFVPVLSPYVMVLRLGGSEPIPSWQHPIALLIGVATSVTVLWSAAKIFRIGVLMYGKPPNFKTLVRWVRMA